MNNSFSAPPTSESSVLTTAARREMSLPEEETLIADVRASLTPSQFVESKLLHLLRTSSVPVSHLQMAARRRG